MFGVRECVPVREENKVKIKEQMREIFRIRTEAHTNILNIHSECNEIPRSSEVNEREKIRERERRKNKTTN